MKTGNPKITFGNGSAFLGFLVLWVNQPGLAATRPSPFLPYTPLGTASKSSLSKPIDSFVLKGTGQGPGVQFALFWVETTQEYVMIHKGEAVGREMFRLVDILEQETQIQVIFDRQVQDLDGKPVTLRKWFAMKRQGS
jgi:hypothetical protein